MKPVLNVLQRWQESKPKTGELKSYHPRYLSKPSESTPGTLALKPVSMRWSRLLQDSKKPVPEQLICINIFSDTWVGQNFTKRQQRIGGKSFAKFVKWQRKRRETQFWTFKIGGKIIQNVKATLRKLWCDKKRILLSLKSVITNFPWIFHSFESTELQFFSLNWIY